MVFGKIKSGFESLTNFNEEIPNTAEEVRQNTELEITEVSYDELQKMSGERFLDISKNSRLQCVTEPRVTSTEVLGKQKNVMNINFTFNGVFNKDLYLDVTAGQILPDKVDSVEKNGITYTRKGLEGEFFDENNKRLIIHQNDQLKIPDLISNNKYDNLTKNIKSDYDTFIKNNPTYADSRFMPAIKLALRHGIEPLFALRLTPYLNQGNNRYSYKNMEALVIEVGRSLNGIKERFNKIIYDKVTSLKLAKDILQENFSNFLEKYGYSTEKRDNPLFQKDNNENVDSLENLGGSRKKIVDSALTAYKNKSTLGAAHCTDWVDKIYKQTLKKSVYNCPKSFNGIKKIPTGTGLGVSAYAPESKINGIQAGDHLIVDKPKKGRYGVGRTHSVISLGEANNGLLKVVSYPNHGIPPKIEIYDLEGKGRGDKDGKAIRIQHPA